MPLVPLTPEKKWKSCTHPEHNPPGHMVVMEPCEWVCPSCGKAVVLQPIRCKTQNIKDDGHSVRA